jgi:glycosyltransferase involved in cell wall biosynthesis
MSVKRSSTNNLVVAIYYHPEAYPPTLNAINELSNVFDAIDIIYRPNLIGDWKYPHNVNAIASGKYISGSDQEKASLYKKIFFFKAFAIDFFKSCKVQQPSCILCYDSLALLSYYLIKPFLRFDHKIWYHNHDVSENTFMRKYSLGWFAKKVETSFIKKLDIFTLPTDERLPYFNMSQFKGKYFCIPNYPSLNFYKSFYTERQLEKEVKIIFQGRIDKNHGIEEIIPLLKKSIAGHSFKLILKGYCKDEYRLEIERLADTNDVKNLVEFYGFTSYKEVPALASTCHIGIGIFAKDDVMNKTLGTASNKVYEYAAVGLPVLYKEGSNFKKYLDKYNWAFPVELSTSSIEIQIGKIIADYNEYSKAAHTSFCKELNFEYNFCNVKNYIQLICKK